MLERIRQTAQTVKDYDRLLRKRDKHGKTLIRTYGEKVIRKTITSVIPEPVMQERVIEKTEVVREIPVFTPPAETFSPSYPDLDDRLSAYIDPIHQSLGELHRRIDDLATREIVATLTSEKVVYEDRLSDLEAKLRDRDTELRRSKSVLTNTTSKLNDLGTPLPLHGYASHRAKARTSQDIYESRRHGEAILVDMGLPTSDYGSKVIEQLENGSVEASATTSVPNPQKRNWWSPKRIVDEWRVPQNLIPVRHPNGSVVNYENKNVITRPFYGGVAAALLAGTVIGGILASHKHETPPVVASADTTTTKFSSNEVYGPPVPSDWEPGISQTVVLKSVDESTRTFPVRESTLSSEIDINTTPGLQTAIQEATTNLSPETVTNAQKMIEEWDKREINVYYFLNNDRAFGDVSDYNAKIDALSYQVYKSRYQNNKINFQPWDNKEDPQDNLQLESIKKTQQFQEIKLALLAFSGQRSKEFGNNGQSPFSEKTDNDGHLKTFFDHYKDPNCNHSSQDCQGPAHLEKYFALIVPKESSGKPEKADGGGYYSVINRFTNAEVLLPIRNR